MRVPDWWQAVLLAGASWRTWRLLAQDVILDPLRSRLFGLQGWEEGQPVPDSYREGLAEFVTCPACFGFWITAAWWGAWQMFPHATEVAGGLTLLSAVVILVSHLDRD